MKPPTHKGCTPYVGKLCLYLELVNQQFSLQTVVDSPRMFSVDEGVSSGQLNVTKELIVIWSVISSSL